MGLFRRNLVDQEVAAWQFENFEFLIDNLSGAPGLTDTDLWLPTDVHFGAPNGEVLKGEELAHFTYGRILEQCQIGPDFSVQLMAVRTAPSAFLGESAILRSEKLACGVYSARQNSDGQWEEAITIDLELTTSPTNLIATLAHELGHALHNRMPEPFAGDPSLYELFTDLTAVYLGYGVFLANSRFSFETSSLGWEANGAGYLPEADLIFALALFMQIKRISSEHAKPHLKPRLHKSLDKAFRQLSKFEDRIESLRKRVPANLAPLS